MHPWIAKNIVYASLQKLRHEDIYGCLEELEKSQWYPIETIRELQWKKLKVILQHAYKNVPFYKNMFDQNKLKIEDIRTFEDFQRVPILDKEHLRENADELMARNRSRRLDEKHSGGTLGKPLIIFKDRYSTAYLRAAMWRSYRWYGVDIGEKQGRIWGFSFNPRTAKKQRMQDLLLNRIRLSPFNISQDTTRQHFEFLKRFKAAYIYGWPSVLHKLAQFMREQNINAKELNLKVIICTSEVLHEHQRKVIESSFGCPVRNEYGGGETGTIAHECPQGNMHLTSDNLYIEFINNGKACSPGESGEIIVTELNHYSMPLIRYRNGDIGKPSNISCPCGRGLEVVEEIEGRILDMLVTTDGRCVAGNSICYISFDLIEKGGGIKDFRVVQRSRRDLEVTLVKDTNFSEGCLDFMEGEVHKLLGREVNVSFKFTDDILSEPSGKRRFVVSELPN